LALPFRSVKLICHSRLLLGLSLVSGVITTVALGGLVLILGSSTGNLVEHFWARPESWYGAAAWYLLVAASFVVLLVVAANTLPLLLLAPLQDPLSEATEALCGGFEPTRFSVATLVKSAAISVVHTLQRVVWLLGGHLLLLTLNWVPGLGTVLWTASSLLWTTWWLAGEYLSVPMARWMYPFLEVHRALKARRALALGFGAAVHLILWVPVLNFFFIPLAIVGGTLLFRSLRAVGVIPKPSTGNALTGHLGAPPR
jgi:CysZ protein